MRQFLTELAELNCASGNSAWVANIKMKEATVKDATATIGIKLRCMVLNADDCVISDVDLLCLLQDELKVVYALVGVRDFAVFLDTIIDCCDVL
mmetsp:Transcript_7111/g.9442  ORF Transcript_7111/g.9442 Transcript_7111/m.9442 type:complete len:94 (-) Transcript_7111:50-331(-)